MEISSGSKFSSIWILLPTNMSHSANRIVSRTSQNYGDRRERQPSAGHFGVATDRSGPTTARSATHFALVRRPRTVHQTSRGRTNHQVGPMIASASGIGRKPYDSEIGKSAI